MKICCPDCGYTREMPDDRIPERTVVASCPSCGCRFRFSRSQGAFEVVSHGRTMGADENALPASAVIPKTVAQEEAAQHAHSVTDEAASARPAEDGQPKDARSASNAVPSKRQLEEDKPADAPIWPSMDEDEQARHQGPEMWGRVPGEEETRQSGASFNPWEQAPQPAGYVQAFYQTCIRVMFAPTRFFASLGSAGWQKPLLFYLILCVIQTVVERLWAELFLSYLGPIAASDPNFARLSTLLSSQGNVILTILLRAGVVTLQLYLFAALLHFCIRLVTRGQSDYSRVFQVLAYSEAPGILCLVPVAGMIAGFVWGLICMLYGLRAAFRLTWAQTLAAFLPVLCLMLPAFMQVMNFMKG